MSGPVTRPPLRRSILRGGSFSLWRGGPMAGETIRVFLVSLRFAVDESGRRKFMEPPTGATLQPIGRYTVIANLVFVPAKFFRSLA